MKKETLENMEKMGGYIWQNMCFVCAKEGIICQATPSGIMGVWEILLNENFKANLNLGRSDNDAMEKCAKRVKILNPELSLV